MVANSVKEPFDSPDWIFEVKLDDYRGIAVFDTGGKPRLCSKNGLPLEQRSPAVAKALSKLKLRSTILDGEVVAVDESGIPRFTFRSVFRNSRPRQLSITFRCALERRPGHYPEPLMERRRVLERTIKSTAGIQVGTYVEGEGRALFNLTKQKGMERGHRETERQHLSAGEADLRWLKIKARCSRNSWWEDSRKGKAAVCVWVRSD
jgi:bifunctional non-homologous end joining protein LigD